MKIVILGLSISSSWGNGHATTYRGLVRALARRGHDVLFLERDQPWYAEHRDLPRPSFCGVAIYRNLRELRRYSDEIATADCVILGSYVPEGTRVGKWLLGIAEGATAFYDIDTPVTMARLERDDCEYLSPSLIPEFDLYLSFTGGQTLDLIERQYGARRALPFYCSVDPERYYPLEMRKKWDLGYLGTYSPDRQPALVRLLCRPAIELLTKNFVVAGPQYPSKLRWPGNVQRIAHLSPEQHCSFYNAQRYTLNITRRDMVRAGWSPSVRLFEAAACGTPIISDRWPGIENFFIPKVEILLAQSTGEMVEILRELPEEERALIGKRARHRVLAQHTATHRAAALERLIQEYKPAAAAEPLEELVT